MSETIAYTMAKAYIRFGTMREACTAVREIYPQVSEKELLTMWEAIDAYVDLLEPQQLI